eukprot:212735_1
MGSSHSVRTCTFPAIETQHNTNCSTRDWVLSQKEENADKLVYGYIHLFHGHHFPPELVNLCLLFYLLGESFNAKLHGENIQIVSSNKAILHLSSSSSICGSNIIDTQQHPSSIFSWTIKLYANGPAKMQLGIGILSTCDHINRHCHCNRIINSNCFAYDQSQCSYFSLYTTTGYCTLDSSNSLSKVNGFNHDALLVYNADSVKDNIIRMELNTKYRIIKYYINGFDAGVAYNQIDFTKKYRFAVCLYKKDTIIEIIDFAISDDTSWH